MIELSVVIPTLNRCNLLQEALNSLANQTYSKNRFEVIVVDNGSVDKTKEIVDQYKSILPNLKYIYDERPGLHVGRHAGLKAAKGEILVYGDDDIYALPTWLEAIAESFSDNKVVLVGGNNYPKFEGKPPKWIKNLWMRTKWGKILPYYSVLDFGNKIKKIPAYYVWGCNFAIRKSVLLEMEGFHPDGMPKELIFYRGDGETAVSNYIEDKGYTTLFNPKASVYHYVSKDRMTEQYIFKRGYMQGISDSYTQIRNLRDIPYSIIFKNMFQALKKIASIYFLSCPQIKKIYYCGYWKGYIEHQCKVRKNPKLLKWILKKNYL